MRSTTELRRIWGPACASSGQLTRFTLYNGVKLTIRRECEGAVRALDGVLRAHGYQPRQADTAAMNCRKITGGSGLSLHSFGVAIDINWQTNGYGRRASTDMPMAMVEDIEAIRTRGGHLVWQWGGRWSTPDYMHVEVVASPAELATGIRDNEEDDEVNLPELQQELSYIHGKLDTQAEEIGQLETRQRQLKDRGDAILAILRKAFPEGE